MQVIVKSINPSKNPNWKHRGRVYAEGLLKILSDEVVKERGDLKPTRAMSHAVRDALRECKGSWDLQINWNRDEWGWIIRTGELRGMRVWVKFVD